MASSWCRHVAVGWTLHQMETALTCLTCWWKVGMFSCCSLCWSFTLSSSLLVEQSRWVVQAEQRSLSSSRILCHVFEVDVLHCWFESSALFPMFTKHLFLLWVFGDLEVIVGFILSFTVFLILFLSCLLKLKLFIKCIFYCCGLLWGYSCLYPPLSLISTSKQSFRETC